LSDPLRNKGTAFTDKERMPISFMEGCLSMSQHWMSRSRGGISNFKAQTTDLGNIFFSALQQRNEVLFYKLVSEHVSEMLPYIYTPTVGDYSVHFSSLYTEPRGLYLSYPHRDKMNEMFANIDRKEVDVIVVTDGQRILGLGDLGTGGMAIPVGNFLSIRFLEGFIRHGRFRFS